MKRIFTLLIACLLAVWPMAAFGDQNQQGTEYDNVDLNNQDAVDPTYTPISSVEGFSDVADRKLSNKLGLMIAAGIISVPDDGRFNPSDKMSRYDFLELIVKSVGIKPDEVYSPALDGFYDVSRDDYRNKILSVSAKYGIINGYGDNSFRGGDIVEYNDAVTMMMRASGYDEYAKYEGGYPTGYLKAAKRCGIGTNPKDKTSLTRAEAVELIFQWLESPVLETVSFSGEDTGFSRDDKRTVLYIHHNILKDNGVVNATSRDTVSDLRVEKGTVCIGKNRYRDSDERYNSYLGYKVDCYYNEAKSGLSDIVYIGIDDGVKILTIEADNYLGYSADTIKYYEKDKVKTASVDSLSKYIVNGFVSSETSIAKILDMKEGAITLISNDGGGAYSTVFVNKYENIFLKSIAYDGNDILITPGYDLKTIKIPVSENTEFELLNDGGGKINYIVKVDGVYEKDGSQKTTLNFSSVPQNVVLSIYADKYENNRGYMLPSSDAKYIKAVVSDKKAEGKADIKTSDDEYKIGDKTYKISASNFLNNESSKVDIGSTGIFYLDVSGKIVCFSSKSEDSELKYGYLINASQSGVFSPVISMKILNTDEQVKLYEIKESVRLNGVKTDTEKLMEKLKTSAQLANPSFNAAQLIKYRLNSDGELKELETLTSSIEKRDSTDSDRLTRDSDKEEYTWDDQYAPRIPKPSNASGGKLYCNYFNPNVIFNVPDKENMADETYTVGISGTYYNEVMEMYDVGMDRVPLAAVHYINASSDMDRKVKTSRNRSLPVMIKEVYDTYTEKDGAVSAARVVTGEAEKTYTAESSSVFNGFKPGDMVYLYTKDNKDTISKCENAMLWDKYPISPETCSKIDINDYEGWNTNITGKLNSFGEIYYVSGNKLLIQRGPVTDRQTNAREKQIVGMFHSNYDWMYGGAILYDDTDSREPVIRSAKSSDVEGVYTNGLENSMKVFWWSDGTGARMFVFYKTNK